MYSRGRRREWEVKRLLEEWGLTVLRTAGSKGFCDLIAIGPGGVAWIQVKSYTRPSMGQRMVRSIWSREVKAVPKSVLKDYVLIVIQRVTHQRRSVANIVIRDGGKLKLVRGGLKEALWNALGYLAAEQGANA